jgi:hypothetical protein
MDPTVTGSMDAADADLEIGAEDIAQNIFWGRVTARQVYRMAQPEQGWPFFYIQGKLAARPSSMRAEMARREAQQLSTRQAVAEADEE